MPEQIFSLDMSSGHANAQRFAQSCFSHLEVAGSLEKGTCVFFDFDVDLVCVFKLLFVDSCGRAENAFAVAGCD